MSDIAIRLRDDGSLNATVFADAVRLVLLGRATLVQARDRVNVHIAQNDGDPLTAQEEADVTAMQSEYDALAANDFMGRMSYLLAVQIISQELQDRLVGEAYFDSQLLGL